MTHPPTVRFLFGILAALPLLWTGCSHLRSSTKSETNTVVVYRLPEPAIQVDIYEESLGTERLAYHVRVSSTPMPGNGVNYLNLKHSMSTRDQLHVSVSPEGLLERITYDRQPRGADVVVALGRAAMKAASMFAGVPLKGDGSAPEFARLVARRTIPVPADGIIRDCILIEAPGKTVQFTVMGGFTVDDLGPDRTVAVAAPAVPACAPTTPSRADSKEDHKAAFWYRQLRPLFVSVKQKAEGDAQVTPVDIDGILYVPDITSRERYIISTATMARQSYDFVFTDGTLSQVAVRKESGLLTIAEIPGQILGTVTGLPADLINVEVTHKYPHPDPRLTPPDDDKGSGNTRPRTVKD